MDLDALKYPIGKFQRPETYTAESLQSWISRIETFPKEIMNLADNMDEEQLNWKYRPDGWTVKQVVHHCADSHLNSFIRFKWTLTEETPTIKAYHEGLWAELADSLSDDIQPSLDLIKGLHKRWTVLLKSLMPEDLEKSFIHPESGKNITLKQNIALYAWHCDHHLAHLRNALKSAGKY